VKTACDCPADCGRCILGQPATITTRFCLEQAGGYMPKVCRLDRGHQGQHQSAASESWGEA
jgi:hypothetical protein